MSISRKAGIIVLAALLIGMMLTPATAAGQPARRIVVFSVGIDELTQESIVRGAGAIEMRALPLINAMAVTLPGPAAEMVLAGNPGVVRIDEDIIFTKFSTQETPWGIDRVFAPDVWSQSTGAGVKVAILDTGIQRDHPDLEVAGGYLAIRSGSYRRLPRSAWDDDEGHGTHVAGTVAALNNGYGVVGVAPDAALYAVKALDRSGSGYLSDIIDGIDWCIANGIQVINMSFGASSHNASLYEAIVRAYDAGVIMVASAGNSGPGDDTVGYPAWYSETIAVAATNSSDEIASFSSRGPQVDIAAPGVAVMSTVLGSDYQAWSGTSMAAPHVTGAVALILGAGGPTGPDSMKSLLTLNAEDLGWPSDWQGAGLVRPDLCVQPLPAWTVQGVVTDGETGLAGAVVTVGTTGLTATAGTNGEYSIAGVPEGTYDITASRDGYEAQTKTGVTVTANTTVNFALTPIPPPTTWTVQGVVTDGETGLAGAVVTVGTTGLTATTGTNGEYSIADVPEGTYDITASRDGYEAQTKTGVTVTANTTVNFALTPVPPPAVMSVSLTTDRAEYSVNSWMYLTAAVTAGVDPVAGAAVRVVVTDANGGLLFNQEKVTGSDGLVTFKIRIGNRTPRGTGEAVATATKAGYEDATGSTTFEIR